VSTRRSARPSLTRLARSLRRAGVVFAGSRTPAMSDLTRVARATSLVVLATIFGHGIVSLALGDWTNGLYETVFGAGMFAFFSVQSTHLDDLARRRRLEHSHGHVARHSERP
jgi:hypothetical protein